MGGGGLPLSFPMRNPITLKSFVCSVVIQQTFKRMTVHVVVLAWTVGNHREHNPFNCSHNRCFRFSSQASKMSTTLV